MTEQHETETSIVDRMMDDPTTRIEMAVADFTVRMEELLDAAFNARPDVSAQDIATAVGVDEARVNRILEGDDALRGESFVRYLSVLGYAPCLTITNVASDAPALSDHESSAPDELIDTYHQAASDGEGIQTVKWWRARTVTASVLQSMESAQYIHTRNSRTGKLIFDMSAAQPIFEISSLEESPVAGAAISADNQARV